MISDLGLGARSIIDLIGNTPVVRIKNGFLKEQSSLGAKTDSFTRKENVELLIKLEGMNPSGSIKDVAALYMILDAEKKGRLKQGDTIIESTSGNTGISLAMIAAVKGYKIKLVMPENASEERKKIMRGYGAELILTPANQGVDGAIMKARELVKEDSSLVYLNQYDNPANWLGHYYITGNEVWRQTNGHITHLVAGIGTGGTIMGAGKRLKELDSEVKIIGVEPVRGHHIQGLKNMSESRQPGIYDESMLDEKIMVNDDEAFKAARWLAREHGLLVGMSTGAAVSAAIRIAEGLDYGVIVVISPDNGFKYLSTELFE
ncbi:MAG: cysteine synthase family protein [Candidatus Nanoarchaeia archaeon]|jgi:cysteine synthase B